MNISTCEQTMMNLFFYIILLPIELFFCNCSTCSQYNIIIPIFVKLYLMNFCSATKYLKHTHKYNASIKSIPQTYNQTEMYC